MTKCENTPTNIGIICMSIPELAIAVKMANYV